ncbi:MAG: NifB/NifX family molybdenum-iron cluster-binding protein [Candidatus Methylarchaceae archaeon HK02M1]|nr:NifB/NifX family molybdenum-iron cluster-binding protein [Candidatus Methylarchaceae archaeon HK02M1]
MKVAVSAIGESLDDQVDPIFGRCQYLIIIDTENMAFEAILNTSTDKMSGAGIQTAQIVADRGVQAVITGNVGLNAHQVLLSSGIEIITGASGTVKEVVERFKDGQLRETTAFTAPMGFGWVGGMSRGRGLGRGMGMGRGVQEFLSTSFPQKPMSTPMAPTPSMSKEQEILLLKNQIESLQQQMKQIKKKIEELGESSSG